MEPDIDIPNDKGPGAEIMPTLEAAHKLMVEGLEAANLKGMFVVLCLMPEISDMKGYDVIRMASNLPPEDIGGFLRHIARANDADPFELEGGVKVLSLQQALRLIAMMTTAGGKPKKGAH